LDYHITQHGIIQDWIAIKIKDLVSKNATIFDIGANVGLLTLPFAKQIPDGMVYSFEADSDNYSKLETNVKINNFKNVKTFHKAIQDDPNKKTITFYKRRAIDGDKLVNNGLSTLEKIDLHVVDSVEVGCSTIDNFVSENNVQSLDFIKIDVEGSEIKVLKGGIKTIQSRQPIILYEYSTTIDKLSNSENSQQSFDFIQELGYTQFVIQNENKLVRLDSYDPKLDSVNVIAFPRNHDFKHIVS